MVSTAPVAFERNAGGNAFWEKLGFAAREDLVYRDRALQADGGASCHIIPIYSVGSDSVSSPISVIPVPTLGTNWE